MGHKQTGSERRSVKQIINRTGQWLHAVGAGLGSLWPWTGRQTRMGVWTILGLLAVVAVVWRLPALMLLLSLAMWVWNLCYSLRRLRERFLFFMFHVALFVFLLFRPLQNWLDGILVEAEWSVSTATVDSVYRALALILLSIVGLRAGAEIADRRLWTRVPGLRRLGTSLARPERLDGGAEERTALMRLLSLALFCVSLVFTMLLELEKAAFMLKYSYVEYYASFESQLPYVFYSISSFMSFSLCAYLATRPRKLGAYLTLGLYVLTNVPSLLGGQRGGIVLSVLMALCYFVYRDWLGDRQKWIGRWERLLILGGAVAGVVVVALIAYVRAGYDVGALSPLAMVKQLFFSQGVTFSWVVAGIDQIHKLRVCGVKSFTLGPLTDYVLHGTVAQTLFGASGLSSGNSLVQVHEGHTMAHYLSYYVLGESYYLAGHGTGSCYLLELYTDMGALGVLAFSMLLGMGLVLAFRWAGKGRLREMLVLLTITGLLWMPRSNALSPISFLWRAPFWLTVLGVFAGSRILLWLGRRWRWLDRLIGRLTARLGTRM